MFDLTRRHLYLCVPHRDDMAIFLPAILRGGVDVVQLREKDLPEDRRLRTARLMVPICRDFNVPFIMNDSPHLAAASGADGVHVGQDDDSVERCRELLGEAAIVGLSTHADGEFDVALTSGASYFSAGPVVATPTKLGREATGVAYAVASQARSDRPVFVTGGVNADTIGAHVARGLRHFVVVRALTEAPDPQAASRALRRAFDIACN